MDYAELLQAVQDYTEVTEASFVAMIPTMVKNVERAIYQRVHLPALRKNVTGSMTINNKYVTLPTDFLAPYALSIVIPAVVGPPAVAEYQQFLLNKDVEFMREAFPDPTDPGAPTHYGLFDATTFIMAPTPDQGYVMELHYFYYPETIVTASTSWLGDNFPNALLYGTLVEAYVYVKGEPDMIKTYRDMFGESMDQLKQLGDGQKRQDTYRSKPEKVRVA
jgi:hypothetical protein